MPLLRTSMNHQTLISKNKNHSLKATLVNLLRKNPKLLSMFLKVYGFRPCTKKEKKAFLNNLNLFLQSTELFNTKLKASILKEFKRTNLNKSFQMKFDYATKVKEHSSLKNKKIFSGKHPKNILFVTGLLPSKFHGGGQRVVDIIQFLHDSNCNVFVYSKCNSTKDSKEEINELKKTCTHLKLSENFSKKDLTNFVEEIEKKYNTNLDIVHFEWHNSIGLIEAIKSSNTKKVFTYMESLSLSSLYKLKNSLNNNTEFKKNVISLINHMHTEAVVSDLVDELICVTDQDCKITSLLKKSDKKTYLIPTCISKHFYEDNKHNSITSSNEGIFVGNFDHSPNIDSLKWYIENVHEDVIKEIPDYEFIVVGRGNVSSVKKILTNKKGLKYVGEVDCIKPYIKKSALCLAPLISGAGIRGKVTQYSSLKKPTVATSIAVAGLDFEHEKDILIADTAKSFSDSIIYLLNNPEKAEEFSSNAYELTMKNFTWPPLLENYYFKKEI